ncbi:unnamed protein product [Arctogadus glacialis]
MPSVCTPQTLADVSSSSEAPSHPVRSPLRSARLRTLNASTFNEQPSALRVRHLLEQQPDTGSTSHSDSL